MQTVKEARARLAAQTGSIGDLERLAGIGREPSAEKPALLFWRDVVAEVGHDADPREVFEAGARRLRDLAIQRVKAGEVSIVDYRRRAA